MFWQVYVIQVYKWGAENADKNYCKYKCNCLCLVFKMAAPGQNPRSFIYKDETIMATKVLTKGKQGRAAGKTPVGRLGFWAGAILKENNTTYYQGPKKQPGPLYPEVSGTGCRSVL